MVKIKKFSMKGIRGVKSDLSLMLDGNSVLLYGDNGSGKSSISDAVEWFYYDKIEHLSNEEIGRSCLDALRNTFLGNEEKSYVMLEFTNNLLDANKNIYLKKGKLTCDCSNQCDQFNDFLESSKKEHFILRYKDLMNFIIATKKDRLDGLSNIIGFSKVTDIRSTFKTMINDLKRQLTTKDFDKQISNQQMHIIEKLGHNITSDDHFIESINETIKPLNLGKTISKLDEIGDVLKSITKPEDTKIIELQSFYKGIADIAFNLPSLLNEVDASYEKYHSKFQKIVADVEKINKIILEKLLSEGIKVLKEKTITVENCPLCLQPKNRAELLKELESRVIELKQVKDEKSELIESQESLKNIINEPIISISGFLSHKHISEADNEELKKKLQQLKTCFEQYLNELSIEILPNKILKKADELCIDKKLLSEIQGICKIKEDLLGDSKKNDLKFAIYSNVEVSRNAYNVIKTLQKEKDVIECQKKSFEIIYGEFVKRQKEGLETFLSHISRDVNDIYQFMHPGEKVEDIKLTPLEYDDELSGITIEYKFFNNQATPPHKYLSESHLNSLGLALFIMSVKAFNKNNEFFILDDVISSFDTGHRKRFADLLIEKLSDYQIILMTHEKNWFEYVNNLVKGRNWKVNTVKWTIEKGTYIDEPSEKLKERIENKIRTNDKTELGNEIRKYLESILKQIAFNLEVKVKFLFNETNEDRMSYELLTELKSKINNHKCKELKDNALIDRLMASVFFGNKDSHNSSFTPHIDDFKAFWRDVIDLENLLFCTTCQKYVSQRYYDVVGKKIRCACGGKIYEWAK